MNEEALQYAYDLFKADGYSDSIDDFKNLLSTNTEALDYSYKLFRDDGYNDSPNDFKNLLGIQDPLKKKEISGESEEVDGSLVSQDLFDTTEEFDARLNLIDESFTDKSEEFVVPELQENFKQYGFDFEENAPGMDSVKILAPKDEQGNREELELPLKQRKVTTGGFGTNVYSPEVQQELNKQNAKKLQDFLKKNKLKTEGNWIKDAEKKLGQRTKKYTY